MAAAADRGRPVLPRGAGRGDTGVASPADPADSRRRRAARCSPPRPALRRARSGSWAVALVPGFQLVAGWVATPGIGKSTCCWRSAQVIGARRARCSYEKRRKSRPSRWQLRWRRLGRAAARESINPHSHWLKHDLELVPRSSRRPSRPPWRFNRHAPSAPRRPSSVQCAPAGGPGARSWRSRRLAAPGQRTGTRALLLWPTMSPRRRPYAWPARRCMEPSG